MERRRLVDTPSSAQPPPDATEVRWRQRPALAATIRMLVIGAPVVAAAAAGVLASRAWRPADAMQSIGWVLVTGAVSLAVLAVADAFARRLLPLQRLLQLCLVFPDRAPSRLRLAVRAARTRRPELFAAADDVPQDAATAAARIVELLAALAIHDRRTRGHCERVCAYTSLLGEQLNLSQADRDRLMWVALVHDIGKLQVPSRLLNKPARPTLPEWRVLQSHPEHGHRITEPLREWLGPWGNTILQHHERYDGQGYPHGLSGDDICLGARIVAVTDAFEVMTAPRPYRRPVDAQSARSELARYAGSQFDPEVVRQFLAVGLPQLRRSMGLIAWIAQVPFLRSWPKLQSTASAATAQAGAATAAAAAAGVLFAPAPHVGAQSNEAVAAAPATPQVLQQGPATSTAGTAASMTTQGTTTADSPAARTGQSARTVTADVSGGATVASNVRPSGATGTPAGAAATTPYPAGEAGTAGATTPPGCATRNGPPAHDAHGRGHHYGWTQTHRRDCAE